jgi:hypothetical protein
MAFTDHEWSVLRRALRYWAKNAPDEPVLGFLGSSDFMTPHQLLEAVEDPESSDGTAVKQMLEHAVRRSDVETVADELLRETVRNLEHG